MDRPIDAAANERKLKLMPQWKCHKVVQRASKLLELRLLPGRAELVIATAHGEQMVLVVDAAWVNKHNPHIGGYIVLYDDNYVSFSPAEPFEAGYVGYDEAVEKQREADIKEGLRLLEKSRS